MREETEEKERQWRATNLQQERKIYVLLSFIMSD